MKKNKNGYVLFRGLTSRPIGHDKRMYLECYAPDIITATHILMDAAKRLSEKYGPFFIKKVIMA